MEIHCIILYILLKMLYYVHLIFKKLLQVHSKDETACMEKLPLNGKLLRHVFTRVWWGSAVPWCR